MSADKLAKAFERRAGIFAKDDLRSYRLGKPRRECPFIIPKPSGRISPKETPSSRGSNRRC